MSFKTLYDNSPCHSKGSASDLTSADSFIQEEIPEKSLNFSGLFNYSLLSAKSEIEDSSAQIYLDKSISSLRYSDFDSNSRTAGSNSEKTNSEDRKIKTLTVEEEDSQIAALFKTYGANWKKISDFIEGRRPSDIKNRFYSAIKKDESLGEKREEIISEKPEEKIRNFESIPDLNRKEQLICLYNKACKIKGFIERTKEVLIKEMKTPFS